MRLGSRRAAKPYVMIIPMIDIIFFLLVFYMMTTLYMDESRGLAVELPAAAGTAAPAGPAVVVTVTAEGVVYVNDERAEGAELAGRLSQYAALDGVRFAIKADKNARHGTVAGVLDALRAAGAVRASITVSGDGR